MRMREVEPPRMRRIIAETVTETFAIPHYHVTVPIQGGDLLKFCEERQIKIADAVIKVVAGLLKSEKYQMLNGFWHNGRIYLYEEVNIGYIVAVDDGMLIPVIKNADKLTVHEISQIRKDLVQRAISHRLLPDEYKFGTFTISNLGTFPVEHFTGILYKQQSGLLTLGRLMNGTLKVTLVCDHRMVDGYLAAQFLSELKTKLEACDFDA